MSQFDIFPSFLSEIFLRALSGDTERERESERVRRGVLRAYIFRTCFSTFVMTGSNWVLSKLYIILHNIFFLARIVPASVPANDVARRANLMRHEYHVTQRLVQGGAEVGQIKIKIKMPSYFQPLR